MRDRFAEACEAELREYTAWLFARWRERRRLDPARAARDDADLERYVNRDPFQKALDEARGRT